jgi:UDP-glucose 4-epimerase
MAYRKVLVTGAAGFIGSHLVDALLGAGHTVLGVDDLSGGYQENVSPDCEFAVLDLRDRDAVESYVRKTKPEIIFHLAADATEGRSQFTPVLCVQRNLLAYMHLLTSLIRVGFEKIVMASSMSVYGSQAPPFHEGMERKPDDIYGICKAAMERTTEVMSEVYSFRYTIVRPHNVYGPRQNMADPYRNVVAIFINRLLQNKNFYIYGDGQQQRAFTYIDDCTPYLMKTGFDRKTDGEIFNIGPDKEYSINELARVVVGCFRSNGDVPPHLRPQYLPPRPMEVRDAYCTCDKAKQVLGFHSAVSLEEGVARMVEWARKKGPQPPCYLDELEIVSDQVPKTWRERLI